MGNAFNGYAYEQNVAFLPLLPFLLRSLMLVFQILYKVEILLESVR